jgi:hypothetical protein
MNFDMLQLGIWVLKEAGEETQYTYFLQRIEDLKEWWAELEADAGKLQQDIYEAVQVAWKQQKERDGNQTC